jgi:branched-chain amino acid transport system permease protein
MSARMATSGQARQALRIAAILALILIAIAIPALVNNYWMRVLTSIAMFAIVTQGLNIIVGFTGYHAFGNSVFFGIGAYACGMMMNAGLPFLASVVGGALLASIISVVLGWPLLRLKGHYFAIATVALNMAALELIINLGGSTGGAQGLPLPMTDLAPTLLYARIYYTMIGILFVATLTVWWLSHSSFGFALRSLRDNEAGAEVMGINTTAMKTLAWALSAAFTGAAGAVWSYQMNFIEPAGAFDISISLKGYIMMLIGGMGTVFGPLLGAAFLELLSTVLWSNLQKGHLLVLGLLIVIVVYAMPRGIVELSTRLLRRNATDRS